MVKKRKKNLLKVFYFIVNIIEIKNMIKKSKLADIEIKLYKKVK